MSEEKVKLKDKKYQLGGLIFTTIKCSKTASDAFLEKYKEKMTAAETINLAKSVLAEKTDSIDWENAIEIDDVREVVNDFFMRSSGHTPQDQISLQKLGLQLVEKNPVLLDLIIGQMNLSKTQETSTTSSPGSPDSTPSEEEKSATNVE